MIVQQKKLDNTDKNKPFNHTKEVSNNSTPNTSKETMVLEHYTYEKSRIDSSVLDVTMIKK